MIPYELTKSFYPFYPNILITYINHKKKYLKSTTYLDLITLETSIRIKKYPVTL